MNKKYIGITLGPIQNTLELSSTPAGLWAASYLFSKMAKDICWELLEVGIPQAKFLSPYFELTQSGKEICLPGNDEVDLTVLMKKGVGFFPDRIIYQVEQDESIEISRAQSCIEKVIDRICQSILNPFELTSSQDHESQKLKEYFQVYSVCMEVPKGKSPVLSLASALDHIESERNFWTSAEKDYLWEILFDNQKVKESWMASDLKDWQLIQDKEKDHIINIPWMAKQYPAQSEQEKKKYAYFALVQADGDRMGKLLETLAEGEDIRQFSKKCLMYTGKCVKSILEYGGLVIYAGGDDLLFLAPVESYKVWNEQAKKKNILELLEELKDIFLAEGFGEGMDMEEEPTLSISLSIQYHKYPLYEALKNGSDLLFGVAKAQEKDTLAVQLKKHSGKSASYEIPCLSQTNRIKNIAEMANGQESAELLTSVLRHISTYEAVFYKAIEENKKDAIKNVFVNLLLDNGDEKGKSDGEELDRLVDILWSVMEHENNPDRCQEIYTSILRFIKFFCEDREVTK